MMNEQLETMAEMMTLAIRAYDEQVGKNHQGTPYRDVVGDVAGDETADTTDELAETWCDLFQTGPMTDDDEIDEVYALAKLTMAAYRAGLNRGRGTPAPVALEPFPSV